MNLFQLLFVPACVAVAIAVLVRTRQGKLSSRQGVLWVSLWLLGAACIGRPDITRLAAGWLGIGRGADLVLYCAILAGLVTSLYFYNRFRTLEILITGVVRCEAIDHAQLGSRSTRGTTQDTPNDPPR